MLIRYSVPPFQIQNVLDLFTLNTVVVLLLPENPLPYNNDNFILFLFYFNLKIINPKNPIYRSPT